MPGAHLSRRTFLAATVGGVMAACSSDASTGSGAATTTTSSGPLVTAPAADLPGPVFTLGVASGDPLPDRVVLWTRLVADPAVVGGGMGDEDVPVVWDLARDREFTDMVASEEVTAPAEFAHSVHVDAGGLEPDSIYWYRFRVGDQRSPVGRTRTLPDGSPTRFDLALTSCQDFQFGEYGAWRHVAGPNDLDLVLFMGDYVYEEAALDTSPGGDRRRIWETGPPATVDDFRLRFGQTKADPSLQLAHQAAPWILMADDHEITDNYWREGPGQFDPAGGAFPPRRAAGYQAWWEHLPVRIAPPTGGAATFHQHIEIGDLADIFLVDTRQFADKPPCRDTSMFDGGPDCDERTDPQRTLLGADQESWLLDGLGASAARWSVLASPVMFSGLDIREGGSDASFYMESWDGYPVARERVADALRATDHPLVLSGDYHTSFVLDVGPGFGADPVCPELLTTGISSSIFATDFTGQNPHVRYFEPRNGYVLCRITPDEWLAEFRFATDVWDPESPVETAATFVVAPGDRQARQL